MLVTYHKEGTDGAKATRDAMTNATKPIKATILELDPALYAQMRPTPHAPPHTPRYSVPTSPTSFYFTFPIALILLVLFLAIISTPAAAMDPRLMLSHICRQNCEMQYQMCASVACKSFPP
jgi:hypothetical protein